jgi:hypothetical protein
MRNNTAILHAHTMLEFVGMQRKHVPGRTCTTTTPDNATSNVDAQGKLSSTSTSDTTPCHKMHVGAE